MSGREIPYYRDYISDALLERLLKEARPVAGVPGLTEVGTGGGLENQHAFSFLCRLYEAMKDELNTVLNQRQTDRAFFDQRVRACFELNRSLKIPFTDPRYETVLGHEDGNGRIVAGPLNDFYCRPGGGAPIAPLPEYLKGPHVTLFGPPDDAKLSINAMNAFHRKLIDEPPIVGTILENNPPTPKWGADDEDSKTPLRKDLVAAGVNLTASIRGDLSFKDEASGKSYQLENENRSVPIKRFPGLALPATFLFYNGNPIPLHLYDFALHLFANASQEKGLS
ncbi:MAG: hypothetical protein ABL958_12385, partial [Bdellovibrionia bacterium]